MEMNVAGSTSSDADTQVRAAPGVRAADVAWPEVERRLAAGALAVLPIGAGTKEHGRHLPLGTDYLQAEWLAARLVACRQVIVWPTVAYGHYPAFVDYPGSISIARETFIASTTDILQGLVHAGATGIVVLNTGISTIDPLEQVVRDGRFRSLARLINVYAGPRFARARDEVEEQPWGGHADEVESSIMLAIAPHQVNMLHAQPGPLRIGHGPFNRGDPHAPNYSPSGVNGDPTRATPAKGERLCAALLDDVLAMIDDEPSAP